ncbi:MAG: bifunctional phosphopantothenoylcysteine decarboxylase/phosphopantothenate--cysteine ligase CoaBC [Methanobacteriota archaeon]|nr:MAG: bifunctional phosphopantothenoylcysteine decarboxylase/phosphopantothenate--cysteine ligase CoaBC [Euryarchaeota archaeon]
MHPADQIRCASSEKLKGRRIVLGITGSIAAVESVRLCRELIRHGAAVHVVLSKDAAKVVHPYAMEFASGNPVITEIDGGVQHVALCGDVPDRADLLLIAPTTANTISKMACGIDDTTVTTFATTAIGAGIPVVVVPAMHGSMINHGIVTANIRKLRESGVVVLEPKMEESKAKMPDIDRILSAVLSRIGKGDLRGKKVLVIAGSTEEPFDDIRVITNRSSGETGIELAKAAAERSADVELWLGRIEAPVPTYMRTRRFTSAESLGKMIREADEWDIVLFPAAVSDYSPERVDGKVSSQEDSLSMTLRRNPKLIDEVRAKVLVGFKAGSRVKDSELVSEAVALMERAGCSFVVANDIRDVTPGKTRVIVVERDGSSQKVVGTKADVADEVLDRASKG